jgi:polysaccharide biosynthesis transport protein
MSDTIQFDESQGDTRLRLAVTNSKAAASAARASMPPALEPPTSAGVETHLLDYVKVVYKRRWAAVTAFLLVFVSATVYTFTATPIYEARTRLLIESDEQNVVSFKQVVDEDQTKQDYYQTQYNILQSRALARKTLDTLNLWETAPFGGVPAQAGVDGVASAVTAAVGSMFSSASAQPAATVQGAEETLKQSKAIDTFLANLTVAPIRNSRLVDVKYRLPDPMLAAKIVNAVAKGYIDQNLDYKFTSSKEAADWLGGQLAEQRKQVEAAEAALQRYKEANDAISLEDRENIYVQKLGDLNTAVTRAKTDRLEKEALFNQLQAIQGNSGALDTFPAILSNPFIQQQKAEMAELQRQFASVQERLGAKHPEYQKVEAALRTAEAKLQGEIGKVVQSVRNQYLAARTQENSLMGALESQKREALSMNRKGIEYGVLRREVESSRQIYDSLLQRAKETGVSGELKTSNIRVIDQAERPRSAVAPRKQLNLALGVFGGGVFAFALVFFFEYLDSRIKSPDEVKAYLGIPSLGMVPALDPKLVKDKEPLVSNPVTPAFVEAFRSVRTNVLFSAAEDGARTLSITSTGPGEGKTTVAANLAIGFAQAGQRVLLIDGDMRRPRVHEVFGKSQEPGLSNLLVGNAKASETVQRSGVPGLWLLTAGRIPPNPAELLGSQRFREFLHSLKEHFDCIILDTPPVMAVSDAVIGAHATNGVVFVIGAEMTSRHAAGAAIEQLRNARAHIIGAVLNRVEIERNAYYYSQYYRREYGAYYHQPRGQAASGK